MAKLLDETKLVYYIIRFHKMKRFPSKQFLTMVKLPWYVFFFSKGALKFQSLVEVMKFPCVIKLGAKWRWTLWWNDQNSHNVKKHPREINGWNRKKRQLVVWVDLFFSFFTCPSCSFRFQRKTFFGRVKVAALMFFCFAWRIVHRLGLGLVI